MKLSYDFGTQKIEFTVLFRKRKTLSIEVDTPNIITVIAPIDSTEEEILRTVKAKSKWITEKLFSIKEVEYLKRHREYVNGESFIYLGRNYSLQIVIEQQVEKAYAKLYRGKFYVYSNSKNEAEIKTALESWYKEKALIKIKERVNYYQPYLENKPNSIKVKKQKKRWGSCTKDNILLFNWKCIMAPSPVLDYIVVHEMCHLKYMDHSKDFWLLVKQVFPQYMKYKNWLKNNGVKYDL